jgi:hypothetical protein
MGITDRARDALRPTNSIENIFEQAQPSPSPGLHGASPDGPAKPAAPTPPAADRAAPQAKRPPFVSEPESIAKAFYVEEKGGERRYFDDYKRTNLAMRATETSVMSKREDLKTIRAMFEIAEARGWRSVEIKGSGEFKREAWIEATARGLEGRGFTPSDLDRQEADRRRNERGQANQVRTTERANAREERAVDHPATAPVNEKKTEAKPPGEPSAPMQNEYRRTVREAQKELSTDGKVMLSALLEKINRQMNRHNTEAKAEMKAFVATELVKKERAEGPIVLSAEHKRMATAPQPVQAVPKAAEPELARSLEPEAPRRTIRR